MTPRFDKDIFCSTLKLRGRTLRALLPGSIKAVAASPAELRAIISELKSVAKKTSGLPEARALRLMTEALSCCFYLAKWTASTRSAKPDAERYLSAAKARAASLQEYVAKPLAFPLTRQGLSDWVGKVGTISEVTAVRSLFEQLAAVPMPVIYSTHHNPYGRADRIRRNRAERGNADGSAHDSPPPLVKVDFTLDGQAFATPQAIQSNRQYTFRARAEVRDCPVGQRQLEFDYITTMAPADYGITPFTLQMAGNEDRAIGEASGQLIIRASQSLMSEPSAFKVRARFVSQDGSSSTPAVVIGFNEIRLRALDQESFPILSRYPTVDIQIPKIVAEVQASLPDLPPSDLDDFVRSLVFLGSYCGMVQQSGVFTSKKKVDEKKDFQQHLLQQMRLSLGEDVREEETLVAGRLDLRFRRLVIELKVEQSVKDRVALRKKYIEQPSQYTSTSIPLGITCILDMTEKDHPPSNVANNITLETPTVHGFENAPPDYPTKIAVVIIDGNLKKPSDYS